LVGHRSLLPPWPPLTVDLGIVVNASLWEVTVDSVGYLTWRFLIFIVLLLGRPIRQLSYPHSFASTINTLILTKLLKKKHILLSQNFRFPVIKPLLLQMALIFLISFIRCLLLHFMLKLLNFIQYRSLHIVKVLVSSFKWIFIELQSFQLVYFVLIVDLRADPLWHMDRSDRKMPIVRRSIWHDTRWLISVIGQLGLLVALALAGLWILLVGIANAHILADISTHRALWEHWDWNNMVTTLLVKIGWFGVVSSFWSRRLHYLPSKIRNFSCLI
jgi:hypothetical protein